LKNTVNIELAIIGGGPAGLGAGVYATRAALKTILFEQGMTGGLAATTDKIENYPGFPEGIGGPELMKLMEAQAIRFGLTVENRMVEEIKLVGDHFSIKIGEEESMEAKAIILATGAQPQRLKVKGEEEFYGRGVSYCATCDGAFFKGKKVVVVGGGDSAIEEALFLSKMVEQVYLIHRRNQLRATKILQRRAFENPKIEFIWDSVIIEILGAERIKAILIKNVANGETRSLAVDGVFIYVGLKPNSELVKELVECDEGGYILTDEAMRTSQAGVFAAGDVRQKVLRQVITAVSDGAVAAVTAEKYLSERM